MAKVRVRAWVETLPDGSYRMRTNSGCVGYSTYDLKSVQQSVDYINNEDSEGQYFYAPDEADEEALRERRERIRKEAMYREIREERAEVRREKERQKVAENRKSKKKSETYVYVVSMIERGSNNSTEYFSGETNLLTMSKFAVSSVKKAKVFNTKASAQKVVDKLTSVRLVYKLYRNIKVVQKNRELFK